MALSVKASGSQTATLNTNHTLLATADSGVYVFVVDAANLANGETLILTITRPARSLDPARVAYTAVFQHALGSPLLLSPPVPCPVGGDFVLRQEGGTGRAYPWSIEQL